MLVTQERSVQCGQSTFSYVDLSFKVTGEQLPADHNYGLYSAIAHICPEIHQHSDISIQTISGLPDRQGKITLASRSALRIRLPYDPAVMGLVLPLAGQTLKIGIHSIQLGIPQIYPLRPVERLESRIVTIKKYQEPEDFLEAAKRQIQSLDIEANLFFPLNEEGQVCRKAIKIKRYSVVGFSLIATDLSEEASLKLQSTGLGGKHRMGCGIFVPYRHDWRFQNV
jgi:CRISPR-associated protein Cas6